MLALSKRDSLPAEVRAFLHDKETSAISPETLLAAFAAFLVRITGGTGFDLSFSETALKSQVNGFENSYATSLPLRIEADLQRDFNSLLDSVRGELQKLRNHKTYSLDLPARHPAFHTNGHTGQTLRLPVAVSLSTAQSQPSLDNSSAGAELVLSISENTAECSWFFNPDEFDQQTISALANHFITFLRSLAAQPDKPLASISLLSDAERRKILIEWNDTTAPIPDTSIHELFEVQANKTPDSIALVFEAQQITYRDLNHRADLLAQNLRELGVGPDVLVGICVERSIEMMVGLLGILKAGGAYVPLDPSYPP